MNRDLVCGICFEPYGSQRQPMIFCASGHTLCQLCATATSTAASSSRQRACLCPFCRAVALSAPIVNRSLLDAAESIREAQSRVPQIKQEDLVIDESAAIGQGGMADVYRAQWCGQTVAVKQLRVNSSENQEETLRREIMLHVGLRNPTVLDVYGATTLRGKPAVVMEFADGGTLRQCWRSANENQLVDWALDVVNALYFLHHENIVHRDIKPDNILICGKRAKVGDFGISRALSTMQSHSTRFMGTPHYMAPELNIRPGLYRPESDVFSLSILLFEMFARRDAFPGMTGILPAVQIYQGHRPEIPDTVPTTLKEVIEQAWKADPEDRPPLDTIRSVLLSMRDDNPARLTREPGRAPSQVATMSEVASQARTMTQLVPSMSMPWDREDTDTNITKTLRASMVERMMRLSSFANIFSDSVIEAMKQVPRHCFVDLERAGNMLQRTLTRGYDEDLVNEVINDTSIEHRKGLVVAYHCRMPSPASRTQNSSSPEIIAAQLSLTPINAGDRVLFLGAKGGYIQTLASQLVGMYGDVWICSSDDQGIEHLNRVIREVVPSALSMRIHVVQVEDVKNTDSVADAVNRAWQEQHVSGEPQFNAIHICGAVNKVSETLGSTLLAEDGVILAPVGTSSHQRLTLSRKQDGQMMDQELRDWGVVFGPVH